MKCLFLGHELDTPFVFKILFETYLKATIACETITVKAR